MNLFGYASKLLIILYLANSTFSHGQATLELECSLWSSKSQSVLVNRNKRQASESSPAGSAPTGSAPTGSADLSSSGSTHNVTTHNVTGNSSSEPSSGMPMWLIILLIVVAILAVVIIIIIIVVCIKMSHKPIEEAPSEVSEDDESDDDAERRLRRGRRHITSCSYCPETLQRFNNERPSCGRNCCNSELFEQPAHSDIS